MNESPYQRKGCPLIQFQAWWIVAGPSKWIAWNWATGCWDKLDKPEVKR